MAEEGNTTARIEHWLGLLLEGNETAREKLIEHAQRRLKERAHHMLHCYPTVKRWEETDDVFLNAVARLH
jgi:DNA-directed RNA polymerase specialized sigma subunit